MTDRYAVINPETLMAMHRAGRVAKLEARIETLEAALADIQLHSSDEWAKEEARLALEGKDD